MEIGGKVFVVTGASGGIGREVMLELLARGARVAAVDLRAESIEVDPIAVTAGERLSTHPLDVTDREGVASLPRTVLAAHERVDGLLNIAGIIQPFVPFERLTHTQMDRVVAVNLGGVLNTCHAFVPLLKQRPSACVVNVSSMGGLTPIPGQTVYGASKAAVRLFTEGLYAELRDTNVAVSCVFPGAVATRIAHNSRADLFAPDGTVTTAMTSPREAALAIRRVIEKGPFHATIGNDARHLARLSRLSPKRART